MLLEEYLNLKNGTDVRGVASVGIESEPITLTEEITTNIAKAFCLWLAEKTGKRKLTIAVGHDSRISATALLDAVVKGITEMGQTAVITGLSTTPSMFMLLKDKKAEHACNGSIMITASHLPFNRNGLKFFSPEGGLESEDIKRILTLAATESFKVKSGGEKINYPYLSRYAETLVNMVRTATGEETPLKGKKIIVDAGNGAGGFFVYKVLNPLGADTMGSQFLNPDGLFPHHAPNPEDKKAMRSICDAVKASNADFGIIFDTDVDRAGAVDKNGEEINRNRLIALLSAILLAEKAGTIITDSVTSDGLAKFIAAKGGKHHRFKRGYKNVINEAIRLNDEGEYAPLAIETSGHAALKENYFLDDGAYVITRLLITLAKESKEGREITDLIADLEMPAKALEVRLRFKQGCDFKALGVALLQNFTMHAQALPYAKLATDSHEGCRVSFDKAHGNGWALLRMSLHDPILPINVESNDPHGALKIVKELYYYLRQYEYLDMEPMEKAIEECRAEMLADLKQAKKNNQLSFLF